jgi:hypothetical protein
MTLEDFADKMVWISDLMDSVTYKLDWITTKISIFLTDYYPWSYLILGMTIVLFLFICIYKALNDLFH